MRPCTGSSRDKVIQMYETMIVRYRIGVPLSCRLRERRDRVATHVIVRF